MNQLGEVQELKKIGTCTAVIKYMEQMEEVGYRYRNSLGKPQDEDRCYSKEL